MKLIVSTLLTLIFISGCAYAQRTPRTPTQESVSEKVYIPSRNPGDLNPPRSGFINETGKKGEPTAIKDVLPLRNPTGIIPGRMLPEAVILLSE